MSIRKLIKTNKGKFYKTTKVVLFIGFLFWGEWPWISRMVNWNGLLETGKFNWPFLLVWIIFGFILFFWGSLADDYQTDASNSLNEIGNLESKPQKTDRMSSLKTGSKG